MEGIEPPTSCMLSKHSTTELHPHLGMAAPILPIYPKRRVFFQQFLFKQREFPSHWREGEEQRENWVSQDTKPSFPMYFIPVIGLIRCLQINSTGIMNILFK